MTAYRKSVNGHGYIFKTCIRSIVGTCMASGLSDIVISI